MLLMVSAEHPSAGQFRTARLTVSTAGSKLGSANLAICSMVASTDDWLTMDQRNKERHSKGKGQFNDRQQVFSADANESILLTG